MNKYKSLAQNIVLFAVNSVATKLIAFVLVPLYTYYLSEGEYGITDMSLTVITLMVPLATLSISDAVLRFVIDDSKNTDRYVTAGLAIVLVSFAIVTVMLPLLDLGIFGGLGDYKLWFLAAYASNAMLTYQSNVARALDQVRIIPFAAGISSLATLIGAFVFIAQLRLGVEGYFIATILGGVCGSLVYEALGKHRDHLLHVGMSDLRVDLKKMMSYAIPLTPNTLFWWVNNSISRFFVTGFLGIASNGLYAAASKIPNLLNAVFQIFQQAWQISAYQEFKKEGAGDFFTTVFSALQFIMFSCAALLAAVTPLLASLLLQSSFYSAWRYIPLLLVAFFFNTIFSFYGTIYSASMDTKRLFVTTMIGAVATMAGCWALVPTLGLLGACIADVVSNFLVMLSRMRGAARAVDVRTNWLVFYTCVALLIFQAVLAALNVENYTFLAGACALAIVALQAAQAKSEIRALLKLLRRRKGVKH